MSPKPVQPPLDLVKEQRAKEEQARAIAGRVGKRFGHSITLAALISLAFAFDLDEPALDAHVEQLHREAKADAGPKPRFSTGIPPWDEKVRRAHEALIAREAAKFQQEHDDRVAAAKADFDQERLDEQAEKQDEEHAAKPSDSDESKAAAEAPAQDKPKRSTRAKKNAEESSGVPAQPDDEPKAAAE